MILAELLFAWQLYSRQPLPMEIEPPLDQTVAVEEEADPTLGQGFRQTFYSVVGDNETNVGYIGMSYREMRIIDNMVQYYDSDWGWLPVIAIDIDAVIESGQNAIGTYNVYGTVLNVEYEDGTNMDTIVLDACGACAQYDRIDLWVYNNDYTHDKLIEEITVLRRGFKEE